MTPEGPGHIIAAVLRFEAQEINEGREPWDAGARCNDCGRRIQSQQFGLYCSASTCGGDDEYVREMNHRACEQARARVNENPAVVRARQEADRYQIKRRT